MSAKFCGALRMLRNAKVLPTNHPISFEEMVPPFICVSRNIGSTTDPEENRLAYNLRILYKGET